MKLRWLIGILALLATALLSGQTSTRGLVLTQGNTALPSPLQGNMRWTGSRLAGCDYCGGGGRSTLWTVDRGGNRTAVPFEIPGANSTFVRDVAAGPDGSLTAVGFSITGESRQGAFIAWISPETTHQVITKVWPYSPSVVTVASDGSIWTVGDLFNEKAYVQTYNVLRHYTTSGQLLTSAIIRGVRQNGGHTYKVSPASVILASNDRIGWLTSACQYIEFSFDAAQLGSYTCPNGYSRAGDVSGVALSSADDLLVGGKSLAPLAPLELDRATNTWKQVPVYQDSGNTNSLLGFDGLTLVTLPMPTPGQGTATRRYTWSDSPPVSGQ
jgi:hypothetical protein